MRWAEAPDGWTVEPAFAIVGAAGRPGTVAATVLDRDGSRLLLTSQHVLFGDAGRIGDALRFAPASSARRTSIARVTRGVRGMTHAGVFADCAVARVEAHAGTLPALLGRVSDVASCDAGVAKVGAATGMTWGRLVDASFRTRCRVGETSVDVRDNLLIRSVNPGHNFAAPGDSGAIIRDHAGRPIALLWGCTGSGDGIATRLGVVLEALGIHDEDQS